MSANKNVVEGIHLSAAQLNQLHIKLKAIQEGKHTDVSFLVGTDDSKAKVLHACQSDLKIASPTFEAMLRSPFLGPQPIRIKEMESSIFQLLLEFIHTGIFSRGLSFKEAVYLALAADFLLVIPLKNFCTDQIHKLVTIDTVWATLNGTCHIPSIAVACVQLLCEKTKECLNHYTFNTVSSSSLEYFLKLENLNISELELISSCILLNGKRNKENGKKLQNQLIRAALPHLRLLTLKPKQFACLTKYMTTEEMQVLASKILFEDKTALPATLCSIATPRSPPKFKYF